MKNRKTMTQDILDSHPYINEIFWMTTSKSRMSIIWFLDRLFESKDGIHDYVIVDSEKKSRKYHKYIDLLWYCNEILVRSLSRKNTILYVRNILNIYLDAITDSQREEFNKAHFTALSRIGGFLSSKRQTDRHRYDSYNESQHYAALAVDQVFFPYMLISDILYFISGYKDHKHEKYFFHGLALDAYILNEYSKLTNPKKFPMENDAYLLDEKRGEVESDYVFFFWEKEKNAEKIVSFGIDLLKGVEK